MDLGPFFPPLKVLRNIVGENEMAVDNLSEDCLVLGGSRTSFR
jgi:hypothetical protein